MGRKASGSNGQPRDILIRITESDRARLEDAGEGDVYAGLQRYLQVSLSLRRPAPVASSPAPQVRTYGQPRYAPPSRFVGKK